MSDPEDDDWIERACRLAGRVGLNEVRVRWKLMAWRKWWDEDSRLLAAWRDARREEVVCRGCGSLNVDRSAGACDRCQAPLPSRGWTALARLGLVSHEGMGAIEAMTLLLLLVYLRVALAGSGGDPMSVDWETLFRHGALTMEALTVSEGWRLLSSVVLHAGVLHLVFDLWLLQLFGGELEEDLGGPRVALVLMVTGVAGNVASMVWLDGYVIGPSAGILGIMAFSAGQGARRGTAGGLRTRDTNLRWAIALVLLGWFSGAGLSANLGGLAAGYLMGYGLGTRWKAREHTSGLDRTSGWLGVLLLAAATLAATLPLTAYLAAG